MFQVVDVRVPVTTCSETMVYIADVQGFGLVVYNYQQNWAWRFENRLMYPDPEYGSINIQGDSFELLHGIFALALSPKGNFY